MFVRYKIEHYSRTSDTAWGSATEMTDYSSVEVKTALGSKKDYFSFRIKTNNTLANTIRVRDKIKIYRKVNDTGSFSDSDLLLAGVVTALPIEVTANSQYIRVEGMNLGEVLASTIAFVSDYDERTPFQIIQQALNNANIINGNFKIGWNSGNNTYLTKKKDGVTDMPKYFELEFNKPLVDIIDKYIQEKYTQDGDYYWFINNSDEIVIRPRQSSNITSFLSGTSSNYGYKISVDSKDVKNFAVIKCGRNAYDDPIQTKYPDYASISKHGTKYLFITDTYNIARDLMNGDKLNYPDSFTNEDNFPDSYPFTTYWKVSNDIGQSNGTTINPSNPTMTTGSAVTVTTNKEYNTAITKEAERRGLQFGRSVIAERSSGKKMLELHYPLTAHKLIGDTIKVTISYGGVFDSQEELRIEEAWYKNNENIYYLVQDVGSI